MISRALGNTRIALSLVTACSRCWLYPVIERTCGRSCVIYGVIIAPLRGSMASGSWGKAGSGGIRLSCCIGRNNGSDASRRCCYPWIG
jgi:hypothetical protein